MKRELLEFIRCPDCRGEKFLICSDRQNGIEIREGSVTCQSCRRVFEISEGILDLLINPTAEIVNEQQGWTILKDAVVNTDELMLALPDAIGDHKPAWAPLANNFHFMWSKLQLTGIERVLDLGAGRCWSTRFFARQGCYCVGIDILLTRYVGLRTADIFIDHDGIYFERTSGDMNELPFRDKMFDIVFINATLHHSSVLSATIKEIARVLKPGGQAIIINEPVAGLFQSKKLDCPEVKCGINEHTYRLWEYLTELSRGGLTYRLFPYIGSYHRTVHWANYVLAKFFPKKLLTQRVWTPLLYIQLLVFGGGLNMIARKPN